MAGPKTAKQPKRFAHAKSPLKGEKGTGKSGMFPSKGAMNLKLTDKDDAPNKSVKKRK